MTKHISVLLQETIDSLHPKQGGVYVDATLGGGGHTLALVKEIQNSKLKTQKTGTSNLTPDTCIICFDVNKLAIELFEKRLLDEGFEKQGEEFKKQNLKLILINKNFDNLKSELERLNIKEVSGVMADLGISTDQLEDSSFGISYKVDGPLDFRLSQDLQVTGGDLLNALYEKELERIFTVYGDLGYDGKKLAKRIVEQRRIKKFEKISDLLQVIEKAVNLNGSRNLNARVFQAIRIAVNGELSSLSSFLPQSFESLASKGTLAIITFHSGEDRIVKNYFKELEKKNFGESKLIYPTQDEIGKNPKSRSAKLRAFLKTN